MRPRFAQLAAVRFAPVTVTTGAILYFALKPWPQRAAAWMPKALGRFLDAHDFLCNFGGYFVLAAVAHLTFGGWRLTAHARRNGGKRMAALVLLVATLESAQLAIPHRFFDWNDIVAGALGVAAATLLWFVCLRRQPAVRPAPAVGQSSPGREPVFAATE